MNRFQVGDEVVCVDAERTTLLGRRELVEGQVYKIRWIGPYTHPIRALMRPDYNPGDICVRLDGVRNNPPDIPFMAKRFRPVQKRKTDISELQKLLVTKSELIKEDV